MNYGANISTDVLFHFFSSSHLMKPDQLTIMTTQKTFRNAVIAAILVEVSHEVLFGAALGRRMPHALGEEHEIFFPPSCPRPMLLRSSSGAQPEGSTAVNIFAGNSTRSAAYRPLS